MSLFDRNAALAALYAEHESRPGRGRKAGPRRRARRRWKTAPSVVLGNSSPTPGAAALCWWGSPHGSTVNCQHRALRPPEPRSVRNAQARNRPGRRGRHGHVMDLSIAGEIPRPSAPPCWPPAPRRRVRCPCTPWPRPTSIGETDPAAMDPEALFAEIERPGRTGRGIDDRALRSDPARRGMGRPRRTGPGHRVRRRRPGPLDAAQRWGR